MKQFKISDLLLAIALISAGMALIRVSWTGWHDKSELVLGTIPIRLFWLPAPILIATGLSAPFNRKAIGLAIGVFFAIAAFILLPLVFRNGRINWALLTVAILFCLLVAAIIAYRQSD